MLASRNASTTKATIRLERKPFEIQQLIAGYVENRADQMTRLPPITFNLETPIVH
jgi:hypothetical protein